MSTLLRATRAYPVAPADAFDTLLPVPLALLFARAYGPIPAIRGTDEAEPWGTPGQRRNVDLAGPGSMAETLVEVDRPHAFAYRLTDVRGPMGALVTRVIGRWVVEACGTGCRITWTWDVSPTPLGRAAMPAFSRLWRGYADQSLATLEELLLRGR